MLEDLNEKCFLVVNRKPRWKKPLKTLNMHGYNWKIYKMSFVLRMYICRVWRPRDPHRKKPLHQVTWCPLSSQLNRATTHTTLLSTRYCGRISWLQNNTFKNVSWIYSLIIIEDLVYIGYIEITYSCVLLKWFGKFFASGKKRVMTHFYFIFLRNLLLNQ